MQETPARPTGVPEVPPTPSPDAVAIRDPEPWAKPARLDGVLERQRFHPLLMAAVTFFSGFLVYQIIGTVVTVLIALSATEGTLDVAEVMAALQQNAAALFGGNALGQFAGFFAFVWFVTWLHTRDTKPYLRVRRADGLQLALGAVGWFAIVPLVSWLGEVNDMLPLPESWRAWDLQQAEMIEQVLGADLALWYVLLVVAVTPAICEEVMFRGYLQRQVERRGIDLIRFLLWPYRRIVRLLGFDERMDSALHRLESKGFNVVLSIVLVGLFFGAFHLRPTQFLPLATLGVYLGFSVWVTGSLWTGVLIHFLNNGLAAVASDYAARNSDTVSLDSLEAPWYLAGLSIVVVAAIVVAQLRRRRSLLSAPLSPQPLDRHG